MNPLIRDLTGQRFGRLLVVGVSPKRTAGSRSAYWAVKCDCGNERSVMANSLINGRTRSCGCLNAERRVESSTTHGKSRTTEYFIWRGIRARCYNPNEPAYPYYGGRGIAVCERWESFENFLEDMGLRPTLQHTIDRIDNDKDYGPDNCRWATKQEQSNNRRITRRVLVDGEVITLAEAARRDGINYGKAAWLANHGRYYPELPRAARRRTKSGNSLPLSNLTGKS